MFFEPVCTYKNCACTQGFRTPNINEPHRRVGQPPALFLSFHIAFLTLIRGILLLSSLYGIATNYEKREDAY